MKYRYLSIFAAMALFLMGMTLGYLLSDQIKDVKLMLSQPAPKSSSQDAWEEFTRRIDKVADRVLEDDFPNGSDRGRAEGVRQLAHMIVEGLRWEFDNASPEFTGLMVSNTDTTGWGGPNVDNKYLRGRIDGKSTYLLTGNISNLYDIAIQTSEGELHQGKVGTSSTLDLSSLEVDDNGDFTLVISPEPHEGNWLAQADNHTILSIRAYFLDWKTHSSGQFYLVKDGNQGVAPPLLTEAEASQRLANAVHWIETSVVGWNQWLNLALVNTQANTAAAPRTVGGGSSTMLYGGIPFVLEEDEALSVELDDPKADYVSFQTYTYGWFDAGDYANRQTSLNNAQLHRGHDGKIRLVITATDPGVPNWLDTEGRDRGLVTYRYIRAMNPDKPEVKLISVAELSDYFPSSTPEVSLEERSRVISTRQRHVQHRFHN